MRDFFEDLKTTVNQKYSVTDNGALAYRSTGSALTDMNFELSALRYNTAMAVQMFKAAYKECASLAVIYLFYLRDCRGGAGEKAIFRACFDWLAQNDKRVAEAVLPLIAEYGRWDDVIVLFHSGLKTAVIRLVSAQLNADISAMKENKSVSLLAKWMPSLNTSSSQTRNTAKALCSALKMSYKEYRKTLASLRKYLSVVETKIAANDWSEVDYNAVPSQANLKYKEAFMRHDMARRMKYLASLTNNEEGVKINAGVLSCDEIVRKYGRTANVDVTLEELWKALPVYDVKDTVVVRDGSGSMTGTPLDVATALAIYMAQHNNGMFKDKFLTFGRETKVVDISSYKTLRDALHRAYREADCWNTDLMNVFDTILNMAVKNGYTQADMPANILIISDMQFDEGCDNIPVMETVKAKYSRYGYDLPKLIFWNVCGSVKKTIPVTYNKQGVILLSGYSQSLLKMAMSNELDPVKALVATLLTERYRPVAKVLESIM